MMRSKKERWLALTAWIVALGLSAILLVSPATAQDVANGQATANVLAGLTVTATQDLQFGDILQGVAKLVGYDDDLDAGIFTITGNTGSGISVYITLPDYIALTDGSDRQRYVDGNT